MMFSDLVFSGKVLKELREEAGLSLDALANELKATGLDVSRQTILNMENGISVPDINELIIIASFFKKPLKVFLVSVCNKTSNV